MTLVKSFIHIDVWVDLSPKYVMIPTFAASCMIPPMVDKNAASIRTLTSAVAVPTDHSITHPADDFLCAYRTALSQQAEKLVQGRLEPNSHPNTSQVKRGSR